MSDKLKKITEAWRIALTGTHGDIIKEDLRYYSTMQAHVANDPYTTAFNDGLRTMATNILLTVEEEDNVPCETKTV